MPSTTKKQAHYMSALDHGWNPPGKHPSKAVAHEFHEADKREGKWEHDHAGGGRILENLSHLMNDFFEKYHSIATTPSISAPVDHADIDHVRDMAERLRAQGVDVNSLTSTTPSDGTALHAKGGLASLPSHLMPQLATPHVSPLSSISNEHMGQIAHPGGSFGAHARMPRIPISDTLRNIDAKVQGAKIKMPQLKVAGGGRTRPHFDDGGSIPRGSSSPGSPGFMGAVRDALSALKNYVVDSPKRQMQSDREKFENSIVDDNNTANGRPLPENRSDYAAGGGVGMPLEAVSAIKQAIAHLQNKDAGSAAATLRNSPHAMAHPDVVAAAHALRAHTGVAPATKTLQDLKNTQSAAQIPPPFRRGGRI